MILCLFGARLVLFLNTLPALLLLCFELVSPVLIPTFSSLSRPLFVFSWPGVWFDLSPCVCKESIEGFGDCLKKRNGTRSSRNAI